MKLVMVRHGESVWNKENRFTGWTDVPLSKKGIEDAHKAGRILYKNNFNFDIAYTSVLKRSIDTLHYIIEEMKDIDLTIKRSYKLNERHYGALQGLNKDEVREKYGKEQVQLWRRSTNEYPPALTKEDPRYPGNDELYRDLPETVLPLTENLEDTLKRTVEYYNEEIVPNLLNNKSIIIVAHGNSLRALMKYLENLTDEEVVNLELETGIPYIYELDNNLNIIRKYSLKEDK